MEGWVGGWCRGQGQICCGQNPRKDGHCEMDRGVWAAMCFVPAVSATCSQPERLLRLRRSPEVLPVKAGPRREQVLLRTPPDTQDCILILSAAQQEWDLLLFLLAGGELIGLAVGRNRLLLTCKSRSIS